METAEKDKKAPEDSAGSQTKTMRAKIGYKIDMGPCNLYLLGLLVLFKHLLWERD